MSTAVEEQEQAPARIRLHATGLQDLLSCPRLYRYRHLEGLQPKMPSSKLAIGSAFHAALASYYGDPTRNVEAAGKVYGETTEELRRATVSRLGNNTSEEKMEKWASEAETVAKALGVYLAWAEEHDKEWWSEVLYVEQPFEVPILDTLLGNTLVVAGQEVYHVGTFDLVVRGVEGKLWIVDHKTARSFPSDAQLNLDIQFGLYSLAARYLWPDERFGGVIYNGIKKVDPGRARTPTLQRTYLFKSDTQLRHLADRLAGPFALAAFTGNYEPHPGAHCGWKCPFTMLCLGEERDDDTDYLRGLNFVIEHRHFPDEDEE